MHPPTRHPCDREVARAVAPELWSYAAHNISCLPSESMHPNELPDWRVYFAARVSAVRGPDPLGAEPGDIVLPITETKTPEEGLVAFPVVSSFRLALSIAIRAAQEAKRLRKTVNFNPPVRGMKAKALEFRTAPALYDYFEQCMIAATFSYQALEAYSNEIIEQHLRDGKTLTLHRKKGTETFDAVSLQREVSTEEKVATVLPIMLSVAFQKSGPLWQHFTIIRRVRDSIIHLKSIDHYVRGEIDRETVFYRLLQNNPKVYPRTALRVMRHYSGGAELSWLRYAEDRLEAQLPSG